MVQFVNIRKMKSQLSEMLRLSRKGDIVVTSRGKPAAVLHAVSEENFEDYLLAHSPRFLRSLEKAIKEAEAGKLHSYAEVFGRPQPRSKHKPRT